jgi:hypothetical protein
MYGTLVKLRAVAHKFGSPRTFSATNLHGVPPLDAGAAAVTGLRREVLLGVLTEVVGGLLLALLVEIALRVLRGEGGDASATCAGAVLRRV